MGTGRPRRGAAVLVSLRVHMTFELASITKHDIAGIVVAVVAAVAVVWGGVRFAARAAEATIFLLGAVVLAVIAVLLFTRTI